MTSFRSRYLFLLGITFLFFTVAVSAQEVDRWESEMLQFEELDRTHNYSPESILFTGSSSIRLWETLEEDMYPYPVIQRGFGGSTMEDVLKHSDRYISVHSFSAVVVFVANDITGNLNADKTPAEVRELFEEFINKIRSYDEKAPIFIMAITPTKSRWNVWDESRAANHHLASLADQFEQVLFVPTEDLFLGSDGKPIDNLFVSDQLHLAPSGYELWTRRLRSYLDPALSGSVLGGVLE